MTYVLRALNPAADLEHFRTAYSWRTARRLERGTPVISFDEFVAEKPDEVSFGLFNGELLAVFLLQQRAPTIFQVHFAARKQAPRGVVVAGAVAVRNLLFQQGATELYGYLLPEHARPNHPMRRFATDTGFFPCGETIHAGKMHGREIVMLKYAARR